MPVTPVGQIPYPLGTDKPLIPADMKNLATVADNWISSLDSALQTRLGTVSTRLTTLAGNLAATTNDLAAANAPMTQGDSAIAAEQNSLTAIENRLTAQDATAATLQNRYNSDVSSITSFANKTPIGLVGSAFQYSFTNNGNPNPILVTSVSYNIIGVANPVFYAAYSINLNGGLSQGSIDLRICTGTGTSPQWGNYEVNAIYSGTDHFGTTSFTLASMFNVDTVTNNSVSIGLMFQTNSGSPLTVTVASGHVRYMQQSGY